MGAKTKTPLFKNYAFNIVAQSEQQKSVAAQLVLQQGAVITQLNGKDYFRIEQTTHKFIYLSDGQDLREPEEGTTMCNMDWLLDSIIQNRNLRTQDYPVN